MPSWTNNWDDELKKIENKFYPDDDNFDMESVWITITAVVIVVIILACCIRCCCRRRQRGIILAPPTPGPNVNVSAVMITPNNSQMHSPSPYPQQQYVTAAVPVGTITSLMVPNQSSGYQYQQYITTAMPVQANTQYLGSHMQTPGLIYPSSQAYPHQGAPYPSGGAPYPTGGAPYPTGGAPYPTGGAPYPTGEQAYLGQVNPIPIGNHNMIQPTAPDFNSVPPTYDQAVNQKQLL